ncbi:MAG: hypothetical protein RIC18_02615 [Hoeflea sp.]|uniref:hypothetical protein n=1 Tax=Hoeflea sp. TaxID=1940281 RepID=UPI0032EFB2F1
MPRIRWKASLSAQELAPLVAIAEQSIIAIQAAIQQHRPFVRYHAGGAQKAETTVNWPPAQPEQYSTHMQMHSELVAVAASTGGATPIWALNPAGHVVANNGAAIGHANYFTDLPHCGYCTVMVWVLDLPLGAPTAGRYNLAVNLDYTVPANVRDNVDVLSRLFNVNAGGDAALIVLKGIVNAFLQTPSTDWVLQIGPGIFVSDTAVTPAAPAGKLVLDWATEAAPHQVDVREMYFGRNSLLITLWKIVWKGIYENVGQVRPIPA